MTRSAYPGIMALAVLLLGACAMPDDAGSAGGPGNAPRTPSFPAPSAAPTATPGVDRPGPAMTASEAFVPPPANGPVMGQGTVLQIGDAPAQFCLGGVAESYPPQCSGPEVAAWDWGLAHQAETASGVTWGGYAVAGTWDGSVFTRTGVPIPLSLYDAMPFEDPLAGRQGATDSRDLERILPEIHTGYAGYAVTAGVDRGFVAVTVVYDDGSFQERMDAEYGPDVVVVQSALRPAG